jgi:palmitoyltransferase
MPQNQTLARLNASPQVVNCVGLLNYKFFVQFMLYTLAASILAVALLVKPVIDFFSGRTPDPRWAG